MKRDRKSRKSNRCNIRLSDDEMELLDDLTEKKQTSKSEIIRDALKFYSNVVKYQH